MAATDITGHTLVRELADQIVEERFGESLAALRHTNVVLIAENETLGEKVKMLTEQRDRLRDALVGTLGADIGYELPKAEVRELRPRTGLTVSPVGGASA